MSALPADKIARAQKIARLLDSAVRVPGTSIRFGLDSVLGLVPGLGDIAGAALSGYIVLAASEMGASRGTIVRMLANVAVDTVVGAVPVLGDVFDVVWKSNSRNVALLEQLAGRSAALPAEPAAGRVVVWGAILGLVALAVAGIVLAYVVVAAVGRMLF